MSTIESLGIGLTGKTDQLGKDFDRALQLADQFGRQMTDRLSRLEVPAPKIEAPKSGGADGSQAADLASTILPLTGKIESALVKAIAPLNGFAARFGSQFDQVGSTIIAISKRIDDHLKFPAFQAGIQKIRASFASTFADSEGKAKQFASVVDKGLGLVQAKAKLDAFVGSIGGLNAKVGQFGKIKPPVFNFDNSIRSMTTLTTVTKGATNAFKSLGVQVGLALGFFALTFKAVAFLKDGVTGASDLNETLSKTDAVLGDASGGVKKFADEMAGKFGLVKRETLDVASGIGGLAKGLGGLSGAGLEKFTIDFTELAADLSSFKNISFAEAGKALQVGLSGEQSDQLKQLGVVMTEATVKAFAYANGIAKVGSELTEQEKLMARAGVIQKALADASGDLEKTQGGAANQFRQFTGTITNLGTAIGTALLPVVTKGIGLLNQFGEWATKAFEGAQGPLSSFVESAATGLDFVSASFMNWQSVVEVVKLSVAEKLNQLLDVLETLGPNAAIVAEFIARNWKSLILDAFNAVLAGLQNLGKNFAAIGEGIGKFLSNPAGGFDVQFTPLLDGFKSTVEKFPELIKPALTDMSREIDAASKPIFDEVERRAAAAKAKAEAMGKVVPGSKGGSSVGKAELDSQKDLETFAKGLKNKVQSPLSKYIEDVRKIDEALNQGLINSADARKGKLDSFKENLGGGEPKFSGALEQGSTEARSAVLQAMNGGGGGTLEKDTALIQKQGAIALDLMRQQLAAFGRKPTPQEVRF